MSDAFEEWFGGTAAGLAGGRRRTFYRPRPIDRPSRFGSARKEGTHLIDSGIGRRVGVRDARRLPEGPDRGRPPNEITSPGECRC